ncbi:Translation initiation factor IF-2, partial [Frankliniella fusca]
MQPLSMPKMPTPSELRGVSGALSMCCWCWYRCVGDCRPAGGQGGHPGPGSGTPSPRPCCAGLGAPPEPGVDAGVSRVRVLGLQYGCSTAACSRTGCCEYAPYTSSGSSSAASRGSSTISCLTVEKLRINHLEIGSSPGLTPHRYRTGAGAEDGPLPRPPLLLTSSFFTRLPLAAESSSSSPDAPEAEAPDVADVWRRLVCSVSLRPSLMSCERVCWSDGGDLPGEPASEDRDAEKGRN